MEENASLPGELISGISCSQVELSQSNLGDEDQEIQSDVCIEEVDDEPRSIILALISQLKAGMDLHKVTFPAFVLEPRSLLERITDFMAHQDIILRYAF
jgi:hypothetical protein